MSCEVCSREWMIRDRIKELRRVKASTLIPHALNYRKHPARQKALLEQLFGEIGYADALLVRETPAGYALIDGHLRAETTPDQEVPVLVLDVTEEEANTLLLSLDPLAGLAETDSATLAQLLSQTDTQGELDAWLKERAQVFDIGSVDLPDLATGDKAPFQSMTFTVSDAQAEIIKRALKQAGLSVGADTGNANSNGNALAEIAEAYLG